MMSEMRQTMEPAEYCREIEAYLCRKNEGHLIRIAGPVFEQVCGWATRGVPLRVAFRGIDQYCERYYAKGPRRRPVRIEFCEADVLDLFDGWRRAVGAAGGGDEPAEQAASRRPSLSSHIERAIARLTSVRAGGAHGPAFDEAIDQAVRALDRMTGVARQVRGEERTRIIEELSGIDRSVAAAAAGVIDERTATSLRREAEAELAPFGSRLAPDARTRGVNAAFDRLVREALGIPVIGYE
jgi:hypothetical protein